MASNANEPMQVDERIYGKPIQFDLGDVLVEPDVAQFLTEHGVSVETLLAKHERLIPSEVMESTDHYQNLAAAPKKQMVLSAYPAADHEVWVVTADGHETSRVSFAPVTRR